MTNKAKQTESFSGSPCRTVIQLHMRTTHRIIDRSVIVRKLENGF